MIALTAIGLVFVRNLQNTEAHLDALSVVLSAVFLFSLSFGLAQITFSVVQGGLSLLVAAASGITFVLRQRRIDHPLIDMGPMSRSSFWPAAVLVVVAMLIVFSLSVLLPLYFEATLGMTALMAGLVILIPVVLNSAATLLSGRILDRFGPWPLIPAGYLLMAAGTVSLALVASNMSVAAMFAGSLAAFTGVGLVFSSSQTTGLRTLPPQENPFGVTILNTSTQIAACVGPSMFIGIMSSGQAAALAEGMTAEAATAQGFSVAMVAASVFTVLGLVTSVIFSRAAVKRSTQTAQAAHDAAREPLAATQLAAIMDTDPFMFQADIPVFKAMGDMVSRGVNGAPLVGSDGKLVGYVSDGDIMRYLAEQHPTFTTSYSFFQAANNQSLDERMKELMEQPLSTICTDKAVTLDAKASLEDVCNLLAKHRLEKVPVLDEFNHVVGSINRTKVLHTAMKVYLEENDLV